MRKKIFPTVFVFLLVEGLFQFGTSTIYILGALPFFLSHSLFLIVSFLPQLLFSDEQVCVQERIIRLKKETIWRHQRVNDGING